MILIAHRANIHGPNKQTENSPSAIETAIAEGYDCEIDVRLLENNILYLGHDGPDYEISLSFLETHAKNIWIHCKNKEALEYLSHFKELNIFWHDTDEYTITSKGVIWCHATATPVLNSICVMPELNNFYVGNRSIGICSDYISRFKDMK